MSFLPPAALRRPVRVLGFAAACFLASSALAGSPRLTSIYPGGAQRGAETEVSFAGSNLDDAKTVLFDDPGFEATLVEAAKGAVKMKVKVAADARLGEHLVRIITASGVTDVRLFYVTPFPMVAEVEDPKNPNALQPIALGTTVYGKTPEDDQDKYVVELKKGQRLGVEVIGARLQTQTIYDPYLTITKENGQPLVETDDSPFTRQDPVASIIAPEDGKYIITVRDSTNTGAGQCAYLLNVGTFARPLVAYPAGGMAGEEVKVKLLGDASGTIEKSVKLPDHQDDRYQIYTDSEQPTPQPNFFRVSLFPNVLEVEPNNEIAQATVANLEPPFALNGVIQEKNDVDYFKFTAKKGQEFDVNVFARALRSPLDSVLDIYTEKGAKVATNDDSGGPDSYLRWKVGADGTYLISVRDQLNRGGADFVYRVEVAPVQPKITAWLPEMTINQNQDRRAIVVPKGNRYASMVRIKRMDVGGQVELDPADLPAGVTASAPPIDKSVDTIPMVFEATAEAPTASKLFAFNTRMPEPPAGVKVASAVESKLDIIENGNQRAFYSIVEDKIPIAVTDEVPVKINIVQPKAPVLQNGSLQLKIVAERKNDFKGPINLSLLYGPPGVGNAGTIQIKENENEALLTISANANAALQKWKICVVGNADFGKGPVWISTQLAEIEVGAPLVAGQIARTFVDQGDSTTVTVKLEQKIPFEGKAKIQLLGLPPSTTADDQEITKDTTEVKFTVKADKAAPAGQHKQLFCQFSLEKDGDTMTSAFANGGILRVDKGAVAKNEEPKK